MHLEIRHYDPMAMLLLAMPLMALLVYGSVFLRQFLDGHPPHWINLSILVGLILMLIFGLRKLSPFSIYRFSRNPARVRIVRYRLLGGSPSIEHDLSRVKRISVQAYAFNRGFRHVVCLHLDDGRQIVDGLPDAVAAANLYDFAVKVARFYGLAGKPGG